MNPKTLLLALAAGLLLVLAIVVGVRTLSPPAPTFEKTPAGTVPDVQSSQTP